MCCEPPSILKDVLYPPCQHKRIVRDYGIWPGSAGSVVRNSRLRLGYGSLSIPENSERYSFRSNSNPLSGREKRAALCSTRIVSCIPESDSGCLAAIVRESCVRLSIASPANRDNPE